MKSISKAVVILGISIIITIPNVASTPTKMVYNEKVVQLQEEILIQEDRILVPLREISELLCYTVKWNHKDKQISIYNEETHIEMSVNTPIAYKNNEQVMLDVPAQVKEGVTYVPVRFITDAFNKKINWNKEKNRLTIKEGIPSFVDIEDKELVLKDKGDIKEFDDRMAFTDGQTVYVYNSKEEKLIGEYSLSKLIGIGSYDVEGVGANFLLVREEKKGILTLIRLDNKQVIEIYKEVLPNEIEKKYILGMKEPRHDGIKLIEKEGNTFYFMYSGLEVEEGKFAYYMKK